MELTVIGLNHRCAPIELRERMSIPAGGLLDALAKLRPRVAAREAVLLSTCNRMEVYLVDENGVPTIEEELARQGRVSRQDLSSRLYRYRGGEVVRHLFRVASSLDSMAIGETQILGQVKEAYELAREGGHTGPTLNPLFQRAIRVAKRIHTETDIGKGNVSIPSIAANLAGKIFSQFGNKTVLILGAGETGQLAARAFRERGVRRFLIVNRTRERAKDIPGEAFGLEQLPDVLEQADIVIGAMGEQEYALDLDLFKACLKKRKRKPVFLLDLAIPRNIHPEVKQLEDVYLFNIDDLEVFAKQNLKERSKEIDLCEPIIDREAESAAREIFSQDIGRVIELLYSRCGTIGEEETRETLQRLRDLAPDHEKEIHLLVNRVIQKILHTPATELKKAAETASGAEIVRMARRIFGLNTESGTIPDSKSQKDI